MHMEQNKQMIELIVFKSDQDAETFFYSLLHTPILVSIMEEEQAYLYLPCCFVLITIFPTPFLKCL